MKFDTPSRLLLIKLIKQPKSTDLVQQSFAHKAESEHLLETSKRAVEIVIETDEQTAMVYINEQTGEQTCKTKN